MVADDGFPGVLPGDLVLVAPLADFNGDGLYAMAFPGEGVSIWHAQVRPLPGRRRPGLHIWQGHWSNALTRVIDRAEFRAAVLGWVAGTFRLHSAGILRHGAQPALRLEDLA